MDVPCRFAETGCRSPAVEIVYVPQGCVCWRDPVQALCEQHLLTVETTGPSETLLDLRSTWSNKWGVPKACVHGLALTDGCDGCVADVEYAARIKAEVERDALRAKLQEIHRLLIFPRQSGS